MTNPESAPSRADRGTKRANRRPVRPPLIITLLAAIAFAASTYTVLRGDLSTGEAELAAVSALLTFGLMIYGLLRTILALVESASERRREAREATERRHGERVGKPD